MDADLAETDELFGEADQVHLDPGENRIVEGVVPKLVEHEIRSELTIEPRQDVQIESRGDTQAVVVGAVEHQRVLLQVHADEQAAVSAADLSDLEQEASRVLRNEVPDSGAGVIRKSSLAGGQLLWQLEAGRIVGP